jgi:hypothetical protein
MIRYGASMNTVEKSNDKAILLSSLPATEGQRRFVFVIGALLIVASLVMVPIAHLPLEPVSGVIPFLEAVIFVNDLIASVLIFAILDYPFTCSFGSRKRLSVYGTDRYSTCANISWCLHAIRPPGSWSAEYHLAVYVLAYRIAGSYPRLRVLEGQQEGQANIETTIHGLNS